MPGLAVILGAGASHGCADPSRMTTINDWQPPLVGQLFLHRPTFNNVLRKYQKVSALSYDIRGRVERGESLETALRELHDAPQIEVRRQVWQVPLYLQELIGLVDSNFVREPATVYDVFVRQIDQSEFDNVLYMTVNYDRFLEAALARYYDVRFDSLDAYCHDGRKWAVVKGHGSVNWGKKLLNGMIERRDHDVQLRVEGSSLDLSSEITLFEGHETSVSGDGYYYPSLSMPMGGKEDFSCPRDHLEQAQRRLRDCKAILVIGFSGLDTHVINLLPPVSSFRRIAFVNEHRQSAWEAAQRFLKNDRTSVLPEDICFDVGFGRFVADRHLERFLSVPF
jgi:hypothetical protein